MTFYVFLFIGFLFALLYLILTQPAKKSAAFLINVGPVVLIVIGVLLTLFRRGALGLPLIFIGVTWWRRTRPLRPISPAGGRRSTVRSSFLEMELDHDTGDLDGRVLNGSKEGSRLSDLSEDELLSLHLEFQSDPESNALLESYLERYHPGWQERVKSGSSGWNGSTESGQMSRQEAYEILGVSPDASREEILDAWRRLIKRVHPDSGGSAFLAAKINAAKSALLGE
ncbi:MAG: DnaJ domain-containing protein [Desulfocapsaceae bacterium]